MGIVTWGKEFEIGVPEMDKQHQRWIEIINNFYDNLERTNVENKLKEMINEVLDYTHYHFSEEEKLMESIGFSEFDGQKKMHETITGKMKEYKRKIDNNEMLMSITVTNELKDWLKNHIMVEDKKYADVYNSKK
ncbi:MAG TPA: bacteriohemerythrin [Spirochaetota bacterium]|nr:bacteriohemerythrin [Spirochaetota bacterium]HOR45184.1 bacteriohemerythrin [Spirochaetota bacterium]HPK56936.1 bacteriohemerythrin [Spirochaetota bacterium]